MNTDQCRSVLQKKENNNDYDETSNKWFQHGLQRSPQNFIAICLCLGYFSGNFSEKKTKVHGGHIYSENCQ